MPTPDESAEPLDAAATDAATTDGDPTDAAEKDDDTIVATLIQEDIVEEPRVGVVRTGSPFVVDPPAVKRRAAAAIKMRQEFEAGLWRLTAGSAVIAAGMLVLFAAVAFWVFQTGAILIAGLGGVMSLLGLTSMYPKWALGFLLIHVGLFVGTFWLSMQI